MIRTGLAAVLLAMAAVLALQLYDPSRPEAPDAPAAPAGSDYYLIDAEIRQMNAAGQLQYRIRATESLHFPDDSVRLTELDVLHVGGDRGPWRLTAPKGAVPPHSRDIRLDGGVTLTSEQHTGTGIRLITDHAWVRPDADLIETDAPVQATAPGRRARATGMTVHLDSDRMRLHHDVRVTYAP